MAYVRDGGGPSGAGSLVDGGPPAEGDRLSRPRTRLRPGPCPGRRRRPVRRRTRRARPAPGGPGDRGPPRPTLGPEGTVEVDRGDASSVEPAPLQRAALPPKRVPECPEAGEVERVGQRSWRTVEELEVIGDRRQVGGLVVADLFALAECLLVRAGLRPEGPTEGGRVHRDHAAVGERGHGCLVGGVDPDDDVAVAGQLLGQCAQQQRRRNRSARGAGRDSPAAIGPRARPSSARAVRSPSTSRPMYWATGAHDGGGR